jgi:hypothetical protein
VSIDISILTRAEMLREGFVYGRFPLLPQLDIIGSVRIIAKLPVVCLKECWYLFKNIGELVFH